MSGRRRWLRRGLWVLATIVVLRLLLGLFLPQLLGLAAGFAGLSLELRAASLSLTGLSLRLQDLVARAADRPEAPPLLVAQDLEVDLSMRHLLSGDLVVVDAALAGARATLHRGSDGRWNVPAGWTEPAPAPEPEPEPAVLDLSLPVRVISARVHDLVVVVSDATASPPLDERATIDLDAHELGTGQTGEIVLRVSGARWLDVATVQARVTSLPERFELALDGAVRGVRPAALPVVVPPTLAATWQDADEVDLQLRGQMTAQVFARAPAIAHYNGNVRLSVATAGDERLSLFAAAGPSSVDGDAALVPFVVELAAPGVCGSCKCTEGQLRVGPEATHVRARLAFDRLTLAPLRPALAAAGITVPDDGVRAGAVVAVVLGDTIDATITDLDVRHGLDQVRLARAAVLGLRTENGVTTIDAIDVDGPQLRVRREFGGALQLAGVRFASPPGAASTPTPTQPPSPAPWPRLHVGALTWTGARLALLDETRLPPASLRIEQLVVRGERLGTVPGQPAGRLVATLRAEDAVTALQLELQSQPGDDGWSGAVQLDASGLTARALTPWLEPAGIVPTLQDGTLALRAAATLAPSAHGLVVDARVTDLVLRDGDDELVRVGELIGEGLQTGPPLATGRWHVQSPFVALHHHADGSLGIAGVRLAGTPVAAAPAPPSGSGRRAAAGSGPVELGSLEVRQGRARFTRDGDDGDAVVTVAATIGVQRAGPTPADGSRTGDTLPFAVDLGLEGTPTRIVARGRANAVTSAATVTIAASGLRAREVQPLLPAGLECTLTDGTLDAEIDVAADAAPRTGVALRVDDLRLRDAGQELAAIDRFVLALRDRSADRVHVAELTAAGVRATIVHTSAGTRLPGVLLAGPDPSTLPPPAPQIHGPPAPAALAPPSTPAAPAFRLPVVAVDALAIDAVVTVRNDVDAGAEDLVVRTELTMAPWVARPDADGAAPAKLQLTGSALPLCERLVADVELRPYALEPGANVALQLTGVDPTALPRVWPALRGELDGTTDSLTIGMTLGVRLDLGRSDPRVLDLRRPFAGELTLEQFAVRDTATDAVLASVGSIDIVARAIHPARGDVLLRSVDIVDLETKLVRTPAGIEVAGLRLVAPAPPSVVPGSATGTPASGPTVSLPAVTGDLPDAPPMPAPPPLPPVAGLPADAPAEFAIDRFELAGLRLGLGDRTTTPPTLLPIADGDIEVSRFTTRMFREPVPFAFSFSLRGGDVELARRRLRGSGLGDVLQSAVSLVDGQDGDGFEQRALFDEIAASGQLQFVPWLRGRIRATIAALELPALRGLAEQGGVFVDDGLLDQVVTIDFNGPAGVDVRSNQVAQHLSLSESDAGPISSFLGLSTPLSTVLFLLRNNADEHQLPVAMHIPSSGMRRSAVFDLVAESLARSVASAVRGAASRTVSAVGGVFFAPGVAPPEVVALPFAAGDPQPGPGLDGLRAALADAPRTEVLLQHELGAGDLERARTLANPPPATVAAQVQRLRTRRAEQLAAREPLAAAVAALYATGQMQQARVRQAELLQHDHATGELERTLAQALAMLADENPRAQRRRANAAAQALGAARLAAVRAELLRTIPGFDAQRIVLRTARATPTEGLPDGGRVVATVRPLQVQDLAPPRDGPRDGAPLLPSPLETIDRLAPLPSGPLGPFGPGGAAGAAGAAGPVWR